MEEMDVLLDQQDLMDESDQAYVVFRIQDSHYAISATHVLHIGVSEQIIPMIDLPSYCRGVRIFDNESVPVIDLRVLFGAENFAAELDQFMKDRIGDHERWVTALEHTVETGESFTLSVDPHQCAFGKWFDTFTSDNNYFNSFLRSVDQPHQAIHLVGAQIIQLLNQEKKEEARLLLEELKATHFAKTKQLLSEMSRVYMETSREMLIIFQVDGQKKGILMDSVTGIDPLDHTFELPDRVSEDENRYVLFLAQQANKNNVIQLLNPKALP